MFEDDPEVFNLKSMTKTEKRIWLMAYVANQPQPNGYAPHGIETAIYWACCAVYHFRGISRTPTNNDCKLMFDYIRKVSK